jgi:precorrin-2 dehydrogenase/sirohydrochlorin ferrochelatase
MAYPLFVNLQGKRCVVIGAGSVAEKRVIALQEQGAVIRLVAPQATSALKELAATGAISWMRSLYYPAHLEGAFLVVAATDLREINKAVARDANERNMLVCCADDAAVGNYITGASIERGELKIALTTSGVSPTLTAIIKSRIESQFPDEWSAWVDLFGAIRSDIQMLPTESKRKSAVNDVLNDEAIAELINAGNRQLAEEEAKKCILSHSV